MTRSFGVSALLVLALSAAASADDLDRYRHPKGMPSAIGRAIKITDRRGHDLPLDTTFADEHGGTVRLGDLIPKDRPALLQFVYFKCPGLCNAVLNGTVEMLKGMKWTPGKQFVLITVSINPQETPNLARLKKENYLRELGKDGAGDGWHFLTGTKKEIDRLTQAAGFNYRFNPETHIYAHGAGLFVLTPKGKLSRILYGATYKPQTVRWSLIEASDGKVGSALDQIILYCYCFDPDTGKYTAQIMTITQIVGIGMVVILAGLIGFLVYQNRHRQLDGASSTPEPAPDPEQASKEGARS